MAILIKKKRTKMLSSYSEPIRYGGDIIFGGQSSRITKIEKFNSSQMSKYTNGKLSRTLAPDDDIFNYEVFFRIDMRKALEMKIDHLDFALLSASPKKKLGNFIPLKGNSPTAIISALYKGNEASKSELKIDLASKTIGTGVINLNPYINQCNYRNGQGIDKKIFGITREITLKKVKSGRSAKTDKKVSLSFVNNESIESNINPLENTGVIFENEYYRMIESGIDPAMVFFPSPGPSKTSSGETSIVSKMYPAKILKSRVDLIRNSFETMQPTGENRNKITDKDIVVAEETTVIDRFKVIKCNFKVARSMLKNIDSDFIFSVSVKDPEGNTTTEIFEVPIYHVVNIENYYIPDYLPEFSLSRHNRGIGHTGVNLYLDNIQKEKISNFKIETRKISDDKPLIHCPFNNNSYVLETFELKGAMNQESFRVGKVESLNDTQMIIGRPYVSTTANNIVSNISNSSTAAGKCFTYLHSGIDINNYHGGLSIDHFVISDKVAGVSFHRRKIGETIFTPINYTNQRAIGKEISATVSSVGENISLSAGVGKAGSFMDRLGTSPANEAVFQYKKRIFFKNGGDIWGKNIITIKNNKILKFVKVKISNLSEPDEKTGDGTVSFNISGEVAQTNTDLILDILRETGKSDIFGDVIRSTRGSLSDSIIFGITRTNLTTSESVFLGYYKSGLFIDENKGYPKLEKGSKYKYTANAYLVNPEIVENYFNMSVAYNKQAITQLKQVRMPTYVQRIQNVAERDMTRTKSIGSNAVSKTSIADFSNLKIQKYYSGKSLESGNISNISDFSQDYNFENYSTGDAKSIYINMSKINHTIIADSNSSISRSSSGSPVVRFNVLGDFGKLDFVIMTCMRNGVEKIVGACKPDKAGSVFFIDYSSNNFVGQAEYFGITVSINGSIGEKTSVGKTILLRQNPGNMKSKLVMQGRI